MSANVHRANRRAQRDTLGRIRCGAQSWSEQRIRRGGDERGGDFAAETMGDGAASVGIIAPGVPIMEKCARASASAECAAGATSASCAAVTAQH